VIHILLHISGSWLIKVRLVHSWEGTGTRPDYLVNHDETKMEGPFGGKIAQKSRNSYVVNGRSCGCIGTINSRHNLAQS